VRTHASPGRSDESSVRTHEDVVDSWGPLAWCADITQFATASGSVYVAVVLDLATRLVVGWSMATHMRTELVEHLAQGPRARSPRA
jgi:transposase InsO family protein